MFRCDSTSHEKQTITMQQFEVIAGGKRLADVIDWAMRVRWSLWVGPNDSAGNADRAEQVSLTDTKITGWQIGIMPRGLPDAAKPLAWLCSRPCSDVVRLFAKCPGHPKKLIGTGSIEDKPAHGRTDFVTVEHPTSRCTELHGRYAQPWSSPLWSHQPCRLTQFMDVPAEVSEEGETWKYTAHTFDAVHGEFVGYQVSRASDRGPLASARFLFKQQDLQQPGLLDFVFISHTGSDSDAAIFAAMLHDKLGEKKIPAFFDADSLDLGDVWQPRIIKAASRCSVFVAVVSPKYPTRKWPLLEMHLALQSAERSRCVVMPVLFGVERKDMEESTPISSDWRSAWHRIAAEGEDLARKAAHAAHDNLRQLLKSQTTHLLSGKKAPDLAKQVVQACEEHIQQHW